MSKVKINIEFELPINKYWINEPKGIVIQNLGSLFNDAYVNLLEKTLKLIAYSSKENSNLVSFIEEMREQDANIWKLILDNLKITLEE